MQIKKHSEYIDFLSIGTAISALTLVFDFFLHHIKWFVDIRLWGFRPSLYLAMAVIVMLSIGSDEILVKRCSNTKWIQYVKRSRKWMLGFWIFIIAISTILGVVGWILSGRLVIPYFS